MQKNWIYFSIFICNLLLASYFMDNRLYPNAASRILPVMSLLEKGSLAIDEYESLAMDKSYVNGHYYSDKAPLCSFMILPFAQILDWTGFLGTLNQKKKLSSIAILGSFICGTLPFLLFLFFLLKALFSLHAQDNYKADLPPMFLAILGAYGSYIFVYSGTLFGHLWAGMFLLMAYDRLKNHQSFLLAGIYVGLAFLTEYTTGFIVGLWGCQIWFVEKKFRKALEFGIGVAPAVLYFFLYNYLLTGSPFTPLYKFIVDPNFNQMKTHLGFSYPSLDVIWELFFGQFRGLFFCTPLLFFILFYLIRNQKSPWNPISVLKSYLIPFSVGYVLLISSYYMWWGGWCYGPRHLLPMVMIWIYEALIFLGKQNFNKYAFIAVAFVTIGMNWMVRSTEYILPDGDFAPFFNKTIPFFLEGKFLSCDIVSFSFSTPPAIGVYLWPVIFLISLLLIYCIRNRNITGTSPALTGTSPVKPIR